MYKGQLDDALRYMTTKASIAAKQIQSMVVGQPQYTEEKYEQLVKEGYNKNAWVYACVRAIARAAASIPLEVYDRASDGELVKVDNHPLQLLLNSPNEEQPRDDFMEAWVSFLTLAGNAYVEMNGPSENGPPQELWLWRPDRVTIVPGEEAIKEIKMSISGQEVTLPYERTLHAKFFHPTNDYFGLTPLQVARRTTDINNSTTDWNGALVQNYGAPSGIITTPEQVQLNEPERRRISRVIRRLFGGGRNAGKTHLLEGGLQYQQIGLSPKDMDFIDSQKMTREEICAIFGVPPQMVGIQDKSTYNNYSEARQSFYQDTVLPTLDKIVSVINHKLAPLYSDRTVVGYDRSEIEALQEDANELWKRVNENHALTINEKRVRIGLPEIPGGEVLLIPKTLEATPTDSVLTVEEAPEESQQEEKALNVVKDAQLKLRRKMDADSFLQAVDDYSDVAEKMIAERFQDEYKALKKYLDSVEEIEYSGIDVVLATERQEWESLMTALFYDIVRKMYQREQKSLKTLHKFDEYDFDEITEEMREFIRIASADAVTYINEWTRQEIRSILDEAFTDGWPIGDVARELKTLYFEDFSTYRAYRIARTEMMAGASYGKQQGAKDTGLPLNKIWVSTTDERTRPTHKYASGQTVDIDDYYDIGGYHAMHPGDPNLPARERIHCRCVEVYEVK